MNSGTTARTPSKHSFVADDGTSLFYRAWPAVNSESERADPKGILLFHRGHEHSARWQELVDAIDLPDVWFFAWDARGHGRTEGPRGDAPSFSRMVRDAENFSQHIASEHKVARESTAVLGQSVGAVVAATWVHDYAPPVRAMVLATPAFKIKLYVPAAIPGLRLLNRIKPGTFIKSYVKPQMLTHDPMEADSYAADPFISPQISVNILLGLHDTSKRLVADAHALTTPTLMLISGKDWVVERGPQDRLFERISTRDKRRVVYPDFFHSTFWEKERAKPIAEARLFLHRRLEGEPAERASSAELSGPSAHVQDCLESPLPITSPRRWWWKSQQLGLSTAGRLSRGVQIGWQDGFDAGTSLDHVYRNKAKGVTPVGRLIDRFYLDAIGWRGIRQRKRHLEKLIDDAIARLLEAEGDVRLFDAAAGPGRYVLDTLCRHAGKPVTALLGDRAEVGLAEGRRIAEQMKLAGRVTYVKTDAFDPDALRAATDAFRPNLVIVSGLYELFPDNAYLERSLTTLRSLLAAGGQLIYTNQPWHPQHEMIARVLPNRMGMPWVMRCRSQAEMDTLIREHGFVRRDMLIDEFGIFSVARAERLVDQVTA
ncbi:MAG: bifunctional alpha/beta hydrolase/class I SAM-dependent methyltransferase [Planctomycetota bacterium]